MSPALLMFLAFVVCIFLGMPIAVCLGMGSIVTILAFPDLIPGDFIINTFFSATDSFPLLAVPFFVLAGEIMLKGGISSRLVKMGLKLFGHLRASLATVNVLASMLFAALSGSGAATVAAIGGLMVPEMDEEGYDPAFSSALSACAGAMGPIIPPSITFVIYGVTNNVSVSSLLIAAVIPGILMGLSLIIYAYVVCRKKGFGKRHPKATFRERLDAIKDAFWALLAPLIILGGIYGGIFTPTEAAVVASVYGLVIGIFVYKGIRTVQDFLTICSKTLDTTALCLILMGVATLFGRILTLEQIPVILARLVGELTTNKYLVLLLVNIFMLFVGMFMESIAANVILSPILLSILTPLGVDPIHFGIILGVNLAIGLCTPPVGLNMFVAAKVGNISVGRMVRYLIPMILCLVVVLLLTTYIPVLSLFPLRFAG